jgi:hypothetical protein
MIGGVAKSLGASAVAVAAAAPIPTPIGVGPRYHPGPTSRAAAAARPIAGLRCSIGEPRRFGVHLELFARGRVVIVPAGIGISPPLERREGYVLGGRCSYPARTREPTGIVEVARGSRLTLRQLFSIWGQPLSSTRLAGFQTGDRVRAYVGGRLWRRDLGRIPLRRHAEIVLELGPFIPPHSTYLFRKGL